MWASAIPSGGIAAAGHTLGVTARRYEFANIRRRRRVGCSGLVCYHGIRRKEKHLRPALMSNHLSRSAAPVLSVGAMTRCASSLLPAMARHSASGAWPEGRHAGACDGRGGHDERPLGSRSRRSLTTARGRGASDLCILFEFGCGRADSIASLCPLIHYSLRERLLDLSARQRGESDLFVNQARLESRQS
jgi:hypothetical protein